MLSFFQTTPNLPDGYCLETHEIPPAKSLNKLLGICNQDKYPPNILTKAMEKSTFNLSIFEESTGDLVGFIRATSDKGLNANLWNLLAAPIKGQKKFIAVLIHHAIEILKREHPGCSISIAAPSNSIELLKQEGFLIDPGGIRAMGLKLR